MKRVNKAIILIMIMGMLLSIAGCATAAATTAAPAATTAKAATTAAPAATTAAATTAAATTAAPLANIKIGMLASMTGDKAQQGQYASNSAKMAIEEINAAGGILGRKVEIVTEDDLGTDAGAVNAFNKLASDTNIVAVVGPGYSTSCLAIDASVKKAQILTTAQGSNNKLGFLGNPWMYQMRTSDDVQVAAGIKYAVEVLGLKKWAIIHDTETASAGQAEVTIKTLQGFGITPSVIVPYTSGTQDFTSHLLKIQQANVAAVYGAGLAVENALIMKQYRMMKMTPVVFGSNGYSSAQTLALAGPEVMTGVYSVTPFVPETPMKKGMAYAQKYSKLYNNVIADLSGALVYDHVYLLTEAITRAGKTDRTAVRDAFLTIKKYEGAVTIYTVKAEGSGGTGTLIVQNDGLTKKILQMITVE